MLAAAQVVDTLAGRITGATAAGTRVYTSRTWPITEAELPAWRVTAADEAVEPATLANVNMHLLSVEAQALARATDDLDDVLHALAEAALPALFAAPVPYGLSLSGIDRQLSTEGEHAVGALTLRLVATYFVDPAAPAVFI